MNQNEQGISRRGFVVNTALIGAGLAVTPLFGCDDEHPRRENSGPTPPKSTAPIRMKTWWEKRSRRSATKSASQRNSGSISKRVDSTAGRSTSGKWSKLVEAPPHRPHRPLLPAPRRSAHAVQPVTAIQTEYSVMERDVEKNGVLAVCEELGIGFVPWGPVGMGYLTGTIDARTKLDPKTDLRAGFDRFSPENIAANMPFVDLLKRVAVKKNATPAQIALAWLLAQKPFIVPIPGTRNIDHLTENLAAAHVELTAADLREIETASAAIKVHGGRMNAEQMKVVDK